MIIRDWIRRSNSCSDDGGGAVLPQLDSTPRQGGEMLFVLHLHLDKTSHFPELLLSQLPCFPPGCLTAGKARPQDLCPNAMEFAICWTDPSFWGGIKDLLHNEPWDCPLPGNEAASCPSFSTCWVWMLRLGAPEFSCLALTQHRLGFRVSLPDQSHTQIPFFTRTSGHAEAVFVAQTLCAACRSLPPSAPSSAVCTGGAGCGGGGQAGLSMPCWLRDSDGKIASCPCQVQEGRNVSP